MKRLLLLLAAGALLFTACCKKGPVVESVTVIPASVSLNPGEDVELAVDIQPLSLADLDVSWSSSKPDVATVSKSGCVTAVSAGEAVISATVGGKIGTCNVTVVKIQAVDLGLPSGTLWGDRNVGANIPEEYGSYFAWGEVTPKEDYSWENYKWGAQDNISKYNFTDGRTALTPEDDPVAAEFGEGWRMPTAAEWFELNNVGHWKWDENKKGYIVSGDNSKEIFFPAAGMKPFEESEYNAPGVIGVYWTLTRDGDNPNAAMQGYFYSDYVNVSASLRKPGCSIRPVYAGRVSVTGISLNKESLEAKPGSVHQLIATVKPENATEQGVLWTSSDEETALVDNNGMVTTLKEGEVTITATSVDGNYTASCPINVSVPGLPYNENFDNMEDDAVPTGWTALDADGDGNNWYTIVGKESIPGRNGSAGLLSSASYYNGTLTPNNYIFSPLIKLSSGKNYISAWLCAQDASWPAEYFGIGVTASNPADLTAANVESHCQLLNQWVMTAAPANPNHAIGVRVQGNWYQYVLEIPASFAGKTVSVYFRHFDCSDWFRLNLDDVSVYAGE